jgi:pyridoxal 5'-phosphate synthase pdxT subunit
MAAATTRTGLRSDTTRAVGILAVQGAFDAHARAARELGHRTVLVRSSADLDGLDALIFPGGESTVQRDLIGRLGLGAPLRALVASGAPVLATCAGLILLARTVDGVAAPSSAVDDGLGLVDISVTRNAWGRQVESFEGTSDQGRHVVFIRAPRIVATGPGVEVLDTFEGEPILVRQGNITCATFHPELTPDRTLHMLVRCAT